jgi:hypothetical protein
MKSFRSAGVVLSIVLLSACESSLGPSPSTVSTVRAGMLDGIAREPAGNYFIGRRYFKSDYKFWGFVRPPGQPWSKAKLVVFNENQKLAPDRAAGKIGSDNNFEYKLLGNFSGDTVYEPTSNGFYPEFVLRDYELRSQTPAPIFRDLNAMNPNRRVIAQPY